MAQKPSIPKGTRDFSPLEMARRNYIFSTIRDVFTLYGFQQIETPAMENLSTLIGKYGEEGDKLLFKILNSGDYLKDAPQEFLDGRDSLHLTNKISEKGLRYDLTVPFARYVVQHRDEIQFPFRRYQIQPVWRADRPQRGRYREFYQCDADVVGSNSLLCEVELLAIINEVFSRLGINVEIHINNRKVLTGIAEVIGEPDKIIDITVAIDKIDKIGIEKVNDELRERGLKPQAIAALEPLLSLSGTNQEKLDTLRGLLAGSETGVLGINELEFVLENVGRLNLKSAVTLNVALARGLNYYTGTILEVKATDTPMGSISGGGRYDNLTGVFGVDGLSGVGISFGADRIYDVLNALNLYPQETTAATKIIFINFGEAVAEYSLQCAMQLRKAGISAEIYPDTVKMKKQMSYANDRHIPFVAMIGESEMQAQSITVKDMSSGEQFSLKVDELIEKLK